MQDEKRDDRLDSSARRSARSHVRLEQRTTREFCLDEESTHSWRQEKSGGALMAKI